MAIPVIVYTVAMGLLHRLTASWRLMTPFAVVAVIVLAIAAGATWIGVPAAILLMALVLVGFVAWMVASMARPAAAEG